MSDGDERVDAQGEAGGPDAEQAEAEAAAPGGGNGPDAAGEPPAFVGPPEGGPPEPPPPPRRRGGRKAADAEERARHPAVFVDSSAIVAIVDRDDRSHGAAVEAYRGLVRAGYRLFTTNYVVAETLDLLNAGVGPAAARRWLRDSKLAVYHADEQDERRARKLVIESESRNGISLTDAVTVVVMERLEVADAFAVDPNFLAETS